MCCGQPYTMLGLTLDLVRELKRMLVFYRDERSSRLLSVAREEPCHEHFRIDGKGVDKNRHLQGGFLQNRKGPRQEDLTATDCPQIVPWTLLSRPV
jgi:hypothetical protein